MPHLDCPRCHASIPTGLIHEQLDLCPRCQAPLHPPSRPSESRLRHLISRRPAEAIDVADWETITGSQYTARQRVSRHGR